MIHNYLKSPLFRVLVFFLLLTNLSLFSQEIKYTFVNAENTNDGLKDYFEVDVFIESNTPFKLGSGQLYLNYSASAFGDNINLNGRVEYSQPNDCILAEVYSSQPTKILL